MKLALTDDAREIRQLPFVDNTIVVGGINIGVLNRSEWAERIIRHCRGDKAARNKPLVIFAANSYVVTLFAVDPVFRAGFQQADAVTADGQPLVFASWMTKHPIPERSATTDLFHDVARAAAAADQSFFLLGATERNNGVAEAEIKRMYPKVRIVGRRHGYFTEDNEHEVVEAIRNARPDILWVGLGIKKQVEFVNRNIDLLRSVGCVITCGGLFDYFTPEIKRAPIWMQNNALEWLFRTWQEPRKYFLRYLITNPAAVFLLLTRTRTSP